MIRKRNTKLNVVLSEINEKFLPDGRQKVFSITFVTKKGIIIHLHRAVACGLRANMKNNDLKAVREIDKNGHPIGHIYPVWIHSIVMFNNFNCMI